MGTMQEHELIASCDIGTTKIVVIIAKKDDDGNMEVIGFGEESSHGLNKGVIVNIDSTVKSIKKADLLILMLVSTLCFIDFFMLSLCYSCYK